MRATYTRRLGTECFLGFYDMQADVLSGIFRKRKRLRDVLGPSECPRSTTCSTCSRTSA